MIIFNHQVFPSKSGEFSAEFGRFWCVAARALLMLSAQVFAASAQKRRFIKPNKTESPKHRGKRIFIERSRQ